VDAYEAIIGAIYLDGGVDAASDFVGRQVEKFLLDLDIKQMNYGDLNLLFRSICIILAARSLSIVS
jgi:dsRNA-specific ribonuclease